MEFVRTAPEKGRFVMEHTIAKEFHFSSLLKFALPTIVMMVFMSLYTIVDGIFVSRFVGTDALSAVNLVYPIINLVIAVAVMLATGGSAIIARKMGDGKVEEARENFTLIVGAGVTAGVVIALLGTLFLDPLVHLMGAEGELRELCKEYLGILILFAPASVLQMLFQNFFVTAGRPVTGLVLTVAAGVVNGILDYVFIVPLNMGVSGAALATAIGYLVPAIYGTWLFCGKHTSLYFVRPQLDWGVLWESCGNGSSEMVTNLSTSVVTLLFNMMMLRYLGADGVAAITILLYAQFLLTALFLGFSMGVAPVISYNHGSENTQQLTRLYRICRSFVLVASGAIFLVAILFSKGIVGVFSPQGTVVYDIAIRGFLLFSINFLFAGINIFASSFFTALSNGKVSALISFLRTFVFIVVGVLWLPGYLDVDGVWLAIPFAEMATLLFSLFFLRRGREVYHYGD